ARRQQHGGLHLGGGDDGIDEGWRLGGGVHEHGRVDRGRQRRGGQRRGPRPHGGGGTNPDRGPPRGAPRPPPGGPGRSRAGRGGDLGLTRPGRGGEADPGRRHPTPVRQRRQAAGQRLVSEVLGHVQVDDGAGGGDAAPYGRRRHDV